MPRRHGPIDVIPLRVARALERDPYWFVIGGQAVRCFCPYRPSNDVVFGVKSALDLAALLKELRASGKVEVIERSKDTVHLTFDGTDVSIFVLPKLRKYAERGALTFDGIVATKLHAILDRGTRRDFFDLYVMMQEERVGLADCLRSLRELHGAEINDGLLLRAVSYFDDADAEARLPGEGADDWRRVKAFFTAAAGALITPPLAALSIQSRVIDVRSRSGADGTGRGPRGRRDSRRGAKKPPRR